MQNISKRKNIIFTALAICCLLIIPIYDWISNQKVVAYENTGRETIASFYKAQETHKTAFKSYFLQSDQLRKEVPLDQLPNDRLYTSADELPAEYKKFLPSEALPFLKKDSFRLILAVKNIYANEVCFWMVDENGKPKKYPERFIPETSK